MAKNIDARRDNGGKEKLNQEVMEHIYSLIPAYITAKDNKDHKEIKRLENEMTRNGELFENSSITPYYSICRAILNGDQIPHTNVGRQLVTFLIEKIKDDYSHEKYVAAVKQYHKYLTRGSYATKPFKEYREKGKRYAEELGLELDFSKADNNPVSEIEDEIEKSEHIDADIVFIAEVNEIVINDESDRAPQPNLDLEDNGKINYNFTGVSSKSSKQAGQKEKNKKEKGNRGEQLAIKIESQRLTRLGHPELISKINHVAKEKDGLGYDIESVDVTKTGEIIPRYIEVKATEYSSDTPFYISYRELLQSKILGDQYYIYRIYNMKSKSESVDYYILQGDVEQYYQIVPTEYLVRTK